MNKKTQKKILKEAQKNPIIIVALVLVTLLVMGGLFIYYWFFAPDNEPPIYEIPEGTAEFHYIDVGQGDSTLIMADGETVLIDTGVSDSDDTVIKYLQSKEIKTIDYFIITHFDADHYGEAVDILDAFSVETLIIPDQVKYNSDKKEQVSYTKFMQKVAELPEIYVCVVENSDTIGDRIEIDDIIDIDSDDDRIISIGKIDPNIEGDKADLVLEFLGPIADSYTDDNDYSIIFTARWGNNKLLFTGDAEKAAEKDFVQRYSTNLSKYIDCDVFKAGHHGSRTSSRQEILDAASPEYIIISCGADNKYGHPHSEAIESFETTVGKDNIYRTDEQGTIVLITDGEKITISTEK